jgi:DNA-binding NarL/FixJ family response regulator
MSIRIILVDSHHLVRIAIRGLLNGQRDMEVVADVSDGLACLDRVRDLSPDVVLSEVRLPEVNGIECTRQIRQIADHVRVLGLSKEFDGRDVSQMLEAGATGFISMMCTPDDLFEGVRAAASGHGYMCREAARVLAQRLGGGKSKQSDVFQITTPREREILQLVAEGRSSKEIAARLHITVRTVEFHRHKLMSKLSLFSIAELTRYALRNGLISL